MPVTTRRQSRGLPQPNARDEGEGTSSVNRLSINEGGDDDDPMDGPLAKLSSSEVDDDDDDNDGGDDSEDEHVSSLSEGEDSESSEFGEAMPQTPIAKRRKLEKASPSKVKKSGFSRRVQGRLQNMLSLPLDVLFTILSALQPMDLLNLARTSKTLRQVLMSRNSMSVWIAARRNAGVTVVPEPPEDMSEPAWAQLLFGPPICSQCSAKNIHRVDFALRRRLCTVCRKNNLVFSIKFRAQCPGLKESVMDLLPYTKIGGWAHGHASNSRFYWRPDLYEMSERMAVLEQDISEGKPEAQKRLKSFRAERILMVDAIIQGSAAFEEWAEIEATAQRVESQNRRIERREALKERIRNAGFDDADIEFLGMYNVPTSNVDKVLTDDAWKRIKTKVESTLRFARENRLLEARRRRENQNKSKAEQYYSDFLRQVLPVQRLYLPALSQAYQLSCFVDLIDPDREAQPAEWDEAATQLLPSLSQWMSEQKERYISLLPCQGTQAKAMETKLLSSASVDRWRHEVMLKFGGQLDLATSVFRHSSSDMILIGRDACHGWKLEGHLRYSARGVDAVRALLRALRLDPASATASMLDQRCMEFSCGSCQEKLPSWRSCVLHFVEKTNVELEHEVDPDHEHAQFEVVSDGTDYLAKDRSFAIPSYTFQVGSWLCNHCSDYLAPQPPFPFGSRVASGSKIDSIRHVKTVHGIEAPVVDVDFFFYPTFGGGRSFL